MEFENILKLIDSVSNSSLSSFTLEEGDVKLVLESNKGNVTPIVNGVVLDNPALNNVVEAPKELGGNVVTSPLVGVFYSAPSPEADAFVKVGDTVAKGATLGIVEAMKLMNEIESEYAGVVEEILVTNGQMVEFGQPLFRIR